MNAKFLMRWILLAIVVGSVVFYVVQQSATRVGQTNATPSPSPAATAAAVVVTYFTTDVRCESCRKIEALSRQAIEEGFPQELASGAVVFRVLNTDRQENKHFVVDYEIANKTVIVSHQVDGRETEWVNRQDVWLLLDEPDEFLSYVREPVKRYLGKS